MEIVLCRLRMEGSPLHSYLDSVLLQRNDRFRAANGFWTRVLVWIGF